MKTTKMKTTVTIFGILLIATLALSINKSEITVIEPTFIEESIELEEWMEVPFVDSLEDSIEVEEWMTKPFNI